MAKKKPSIVIDPGHGGEDVGAIGYNQIEEKTIVLNISRFVKNYLVHKGYNTFLTRNTDTFIMLDQRTALANQLKADLFISIHGNAALNKNAVGIETFFYPHGQGRMQENEYTSYVKTYLTKKTSYAQLLAQNIQQSLCNELFAIHKLHAVIDRKVKRAPLQVLIGTIQPSVLIEVGFLPHPYEGRLLATKEYQKKIARGIVKGIVNYLEKISTF
jgi:N-acetylmuramoyl-L-alanine amidase